MGAKLKKPQADFLLKTDVALTNAETQPEIKAALATVGYNAEKIAEGRALWKKSEAMRDSQQKEFTESSVASMAFKASKKAVADHYKRHRKRAKHVFENNDAALNELKLTGTAPIKHSAWREMVVHFYAILLANPAYVEAMQTMSVSEEELTATQALIPEMDKAYAEYSREKGESEEASRLKDMAMDDLERYMARFWKAARIALEDKPQLLEGLMKMVKR